MEQLEIKIYKKILLKNWKWISLFILSTLILSIVYNYVYKKAPQQMYHSEITVDVSKAVFLDNTFPVITLTNDLEKKIADKTLNQLNFNNDFNLKWDLSNGHITAVSVDSPVQFQIKEYADVIANNILWQIKEKYYIDPNQTLKLLDKEYRDKIINADGSINNETLKALSLKSDKQKEAKTIELQTAEKQYTAMIKDLAAAKEKAAGVSAENAKINKIIDTLKENIETNEANINETKIRVDNLKSKLKSGIESKDTIDFINKQIVFLEQNMDIYTYYKSYYDSSINQYEDELKKLQQFKGEAQKQYNLQKEQVEANKTSLDPLLANHNKQIENYKKLYTIVSNNNTLDTKVQIKTTDTVEVNKIDSRIRAVIVSVWLAFVLGCCFVLGKEYFMAKKSKKRQQT